LSVQDRFGDDFTVIALLIQMDAMAIAQDGFLS
jgi:hypothetical protein